MNNPIVGIIPNNNPFFTILQFSPRRIQYINKHPITPRRIGSKYNIIEFFFGRLGV